MTEGLSSVATARLREHQWRYLIVCGVVTYAALEEVRHEELDQSDHRDVVGVELLLKHYTNALAWGIGEYWAASTVEVNFFGSFEIEYMLYA